MGGEPLAAWETTPDDLVDLVYASALDPQRYDELMARWQVHLDAVLAQLDPAEADELDLKADGGEIERHFNRAFAILERLGRQGSESRSVDALVESESRPAMLLDAAGRVVAVNARAFSMFGIGAGASVGALSLEATGLSNIRQALGRLADEPPGRLLTVTRIMSPRDNSTPIVALTRAEIAGSSRPVGLLSVADIAWSERIGDMLMQVFGLTPAECEVARGIIGGQSLELLAAARGRSHQTVRTQVKSILRKLELRTQAELIRMVAALMQMDAAPELLSRTGRDPVTARATIMRGRGRVLDVVAIGPERGRPVLFIHGMLDGHGVTATLQDELFARGIRLIAPVRPNFGGSSPDGDAAAAPERFADDVAVVMDHFGIARCPVVGHMAGSAYAFAAAMRLGERVTRIVNVSGGVPIVSVEQFARMTPRQRIVAHTARFTPRLLPLILRAGIALIDSGGDRAFMNALYRSAPVDYAVASDPEVFALLSGGYRFTVAQGHRAFEIDAHHVVRDWSEYVDGSRQKVTLVHGEHDPVVVMPTVREFVDRLGERARLVEVPGHGQLLLYSAPHAVLDALDEALDDAAG